MPTLVGMRRRGYTPASIRADGRRIGASKTNGWIDYSVLEGCLRDDLDGQAPRAMAVLDPVQARARRTGTRCIGSADACSSPASAPVHPHRPELGQRHFGLAREVWIERDDFAEVPPKGFFRLFPGNKVRLKYGLVVECTGCEKDADGAVTEVLATRGARHQERHARAPTRSRSRARSPGSAWPTRVAAEVRLYDRLFTEPQPDAGGQGLPGGAEPEQPEGGDGLRGAVTGQRRSGPRSSSSSGMGTLWRIGWITFKAPSRCLIWRWG